MKTDNKVTIKNRMVSNPIKITVGKLLDMVRCGEIISVHEFLQRLLVTTEWHKNNYERAKQYIVSVLRGTASLDMISLTPIRKLIDVMEREQQESGKVKIFSEAIDILKEHQKKGAIYANLDGQSRLQLALLPYFTGEIVGLGNYSDGIQLEINGEINRILLSETPYPKLPAVVQEYINSIEMTTTIVEDMNEVGDVIVALVNKQKGISWTPFQELKGLTIFYPFTSALRSIMESSIAKTFSDYWSKRMAKLKDFLKADRSGDEYWLIMISRLLDDGIMKSDVKNLLYGVEKPNKNIYERVMKYANEWFNNYDKNDTTISLMNNWIVFRWLIDGGKRGNKFYSDLSFPDTYNFASKNISKIIDAFIENHIRIKGSEKHPHEASWYFDDIEQIYKKKIKGDGYAESMRDQATERILHRMRLFIQYFPWNKLEEDGILSKNDRKKPTTSDILLATNFRDNLGEPIPCSNLSEYDGSHNVSKFNGGPLSIDNLVMEKRKPNRSRGSKNMTKEELKV